MRSFAGRVGFLLFLVLAAFVGGADAKPRHPHSQPARKKGPMSGIAAPFGKRNTTNTPKSDDDDRLR